MSHLCKKNSRIPFSKPYISEQGTVYVNQVLSGKKENFTENFYTALCEEKIAQLIQTNKVLLTNSCTSALEMSAILANIKPHDEIIMPAFTFPSTANAFVLQGATPVFVDIREDTLNIDEKLIEAAITPQTKAIVSVHYAGIACEISAIKDIADKNKLLLIEDAAQAMSSSYQERLLGQWGDFAAFSFHHTKNITSSSGGCLCINNEFYNEKADIVYYNGTDRVNFSKGKVAQYSWVGRGSAYKPSELIAALLLSQLEELDIITADRLACWHRYHAAFAAEEKKGLIRRPVVPKSCQHNAHIYYLLLPQEEARNYFIHQLSQQGIEAAFHFIPLHRSEAGKQFSKVHGSMEHTENLSRRLVRLPLWFGIAPYLEDIISTVLSVLNTL